MRGNQKQTRPMRRGNKSGETSRWAVRPLQCPHQRMPRDEQVHGHSERCEHLS